MSNIMKQSPAQKLGELFKNKKMSIMDIVPKGFNIDRVMNSVISSVSSNKALAECTASSIFMATVSAIRVGIEPNSPLAEGYLIPYRNKGVAEAQFQISYRGLINLARRTGDVAVIYANDIREKDEFVLELGLERKLIHRPKLFTERGKAIGYYAVVQFKDGASDFEVMTSEEIEKVRKSSRASNSGPWIEWYEEMAKKTVIRRLLKRCPMSIELATAVQIDDASSAGLSVNPLSDGAIDITDDTVEVTDSNAPSDLTAVEPITPAQYIDQKKLGSRISEADIITYMEEECGGYSVDMFSENAQAIVTQVISRKV